MLGEKITVSSDAGRFLGAKRGPGQTMKRPLGPAASGSAVVSSPQRRPRGPGQDASHDEDDAQIRVRSLSDMVATNGNKNEANVNRAWDILSDTISRIEGRAGNSRMAVADSNPSELKESADENDAGTHLIEGRQQLPLDLSPKESLRVVSSFNLDWCIAVPTADEAAAVEALLMDEAISGHEKLFFQALLSFRYPAAGQASSISKAWNNFVTNGVGTEDFKLYAKSRLAMWEDSLRSLFFRLRDGHVSRFYVCATTFSVVFCNPGPGCSALRAALTGCSAGLQGLLTKAGVSFAVASAKEKCVARVLGLDGVQALYEFLLSDGARLGAAQDVPVLLCEKQFVGGTLHRSTVRSLSDAKSAGSATTNQFTLEIGGPLLPTQISRFVAAMESHAKAADYEIVLRTGRLMTLVNLVGDEEDPSKRNFSFADSSGSVERRASGPIDKLPVLGTAVIAKVRKRNGALAYTIQRH